MQAGGKPSEQELIELTRNFMKKALGPIGDEQANQISDEFVFRGPCAHLNCNVLNTQQGHVVSMHEDEPSQPCSSSGRQAGDCQHSCDTGICLEAATGARFMAGMRLLRSAWCTPLDA